MVQPRTRTASQTANIHDRLSRVVDRLIDALDRRSSLQYIRLFETTLSILRFLRDPAIETSSIQQPQLTVNWTRSSVADVSGDDREKKVLEFIRNLTKFLAIAGGTFKATQRVARIAGANPTVKVHSSYPDVLMAVKVNHTRDFSRKAREAFPTGDTGGGRFTPSTDRRDILGVITFRKAELRHLNVLNDDEAARMVNEGRVLLSSLDECFPS
ncbi:hypothetical protein DFJ73DRAFT_806940 [Zopfochytrium polystomum]|nr:hypothetical protein DFJ73DRAFT_806940 [Zopfochytrium polystomum]